MSHLAQYSRNLRRIHTINAPRCSRGERNSAELLRTQPLRQFTRPTIAPLRSKPVYHQWRHASTRRGPYSLQGLLRNHPIAFPIALAGIVFGAAGLSYVSYLYWRMHNAMANYPERVGLKIRRGLYFTDIKEDFAQATKAYVQALQFAAEDGLHPMSDEVIGIKMALVRCLEKADNARTAIEICESVKRDCLGWIEKNGSEENTARTRNRLLSWACKIGTKLGELYADPHVADAEKSEENLVWAVENTIRERQRRNKEGVKEGEGDWLDNDEHGSQLELLAHKYEEQNKHFFAAQLFLQALTIKTKTDCHSVVLMNNLATSLAQQSPPSRPGVPPPSRAELRESGRAWINQALALSRNITPPERTGECDQGCVAATHNLGEFAEMDGNIAEARSRYEEAGSLAHAIGFEEGVQAANEGLRRIGGGKSRSVKNTANRKFW